MADETSTIHLNLDLAQLNQQLADVEARLQRIQQLAGGSGGGMPAGIPTGVGIPGAAASNGGGAVYPGGSGSVGVPMPPRSGAGGNGAFTAAVDPSRLIHGPDGDFFINPRTNEPVYPNGSRFDNEMAGFREFGRESKASILGGFRQDRQINASLRRSGSDIAWMEQELADLQSQPDMLSKSGGGGGMGRGIGRMMMAMEGVRAFQTGADATIESMRTGRPMQWYDMAETGGTILGVGVGLFASGGNPMMGAIGGGIGGGVGHEIKALASLSEDRNVAAMSLYNRVSADPVATAEMFERYGGGNTPPETMLATLNLGDALSAGGSGGYTVAAKMSDNIYRSNLAHAPMASKFWGLGPEFRDPVSAAQMSNADKNALAKSMSAGMAAYQTSIGDKYSSAVALSLGGDPAALSAYLKGTTGNKVGAGETEAAHTALVNADFALASAGSGVQGAGAATRGITSRGGTAADIAGGIGGENSALRGMAAQLQSMIGSLDAAIPENKAKIDAWKASLAEVNATLDENIHKVASLKVSEGIDIAGTGAASARAHASIGIATAGRGTSLSALIGEEASANAVEVSRLQAAANNPALKPEERRAYQRQYAAARVNQFQLERQAGAADVERSAAFATSDAQFSASFGEMATIGLTDPVAAAGIQARVGASAWKAASALTDVYHYRQSHGFSAELVNEARNAAETTRASAVESLQRSGQFNRTGTQEALLAGLDVESSWQARNVGGSGALATMNKSLAELKTEVGQAQHVYANFVARGGNATAGQAMRDNSLARNTQEANANIAARGSMSGVSVATATSVDEAQYQKDLLFSNVFVRGNRYTAGTAFLGALERARGEAQSFLNDPANKLDAAGRRQHLAELHGLDLDISREKQELNVGWASRISSMEMFAPDRSAITAMSSRQYLMYNPEGNRLFGTAQRHGYDTDSYAASSGNAGSRRPGDPNAVLGTIVVSFDTASMQALSRLGVNVKATVKADPAARLKLKAPG